MEISNINWEAISAIAVLVQAIVIIVTVVYAALQHRELKKSRSVSAFLPFFDSINTGEMASMRSELYNNNTFNNPSSLDDDEEKIVNTVINQLDYLGFLTSKGLVDERFVCELYYGTVIRCWEHANPYITHQRKLRGTDFAEYFEKLNKDCIEYIRKEKGISDIDSYKKNELIKI